MATDRQDSATFYGLRRSVSDATQVPTQSALHALGLVREGHVVGLGSGRAATAFVHALGDRVRNGLRVRCIPTSRSTADLATRLGIPLSTLEDCDEIDVTVDGADEVDPHLNLIKGLGGALVREKIVAAASRRMVVCVGTEKEVDVLGSRGTLPVEVVPFALQFCRRRLSRIGLAADPRKHESALYVSDNGNHILDVHVSKITDPAGLEEQIRSIPGIVGTGLFIGMAHTVLVQDGETVRVRTRAGAH